MKISEELSKECKEWPFRLAYEILDRLKGKLPKKGYVLFETGYGPSGLPHIGTFGEVARTTMVQYAFQAISDMPTKLFVVSDDIDGMRKIPDNVPSPEMLKEYMQMPLTKVPDPFGTHESYGAHMNSRLNAFLHHFGFDYEFKSATELYKSGAYDEYLLKALEKYDEIMDVMLPTLGQERQSTYSLFLPICPTTGRVLYVPIIARDLSKGTVTYVDEQTKEEVTVPVTGGGCKLQWKPDFGMRWAALDVDFEMYGKDHLANSVLYTKICKIIGGKSPGQFCYEMFLDENGAKISKSKGNGISMEQWLTYAPLESLSLYMYQSPNKAKKLYFDVIPKSVDEYLMYVQKFHAQSSTEQLSNPAWYIHNQNVPQYELYGLTFSLLINLASACNPDSKAVLWKFIRKYSKEAAPENAEFLDKLVGYAVKYYDDFIKPKKQYPVLTDKEVQLLKTIAEELSTMEDNAPEEELQSVFYNVGKNAGYENLRDFFKMIYSALFGQEQGPRLGSFVKLYGLGETIQLIKERMVV